MADQNPFLFVHLPLDEVREGSVLDTTSNRRHALVLRPKIVADEIFGACLDLSGGSFVEFPPWKLNPAVFLPPSPTHSPAGDPQQLTYTIWISPGAGDAEWTLIDCGFRPDLQRLKVRVTRANRKLQVTVLAPVDRERTRGLRWIFESDVPDGPWLHLAVVWDPKGQGAGAGYGDCRMFLNGGFFSSSRKTDGEAPSHLTGGAAWLTRIGWPAFQGKLAHFRIYTRELTQQEIAQDIDRDLERLRIASPLDCSLLDPHSLPRMYLDFADTGEKMQVVVKPLRTGLSLAGLRAGPPAPDKCHFELAFRPGTLNLSGNPQISANTKDGQGAWEAKAYPRTGPHGHDSVCVQCNSPRALPGEFQVVLTTLKPDRRFGPRSTPVEIRYRNLQDNQGRLLDGRIRQWLELLARGPYAGRAPASWSAGWTQDRNGSGPNVSGGQIRFSGNVFCEPAQEQMKKDGWQILVRMGERDAPFGAKDLRFPGRVRWLSPAGSPGLKTLWLSDLIVGATGVVSISADLPREVLGAVGRIDVSLDGVSYSDEKFWVI